MAGDKRGPGRWVCRIKVIPRCGAENALGFLAVVEQEGHELGDGEQIVVDLDWGHAVSSRAAPITSAILRDAVPEAEGRRQACNLAQIGGQRGRVGQRL
ncbi:hypothetical protein ABT120_50030 [Nonomuraea angiospora]|uniref:hypothetical protein n=1 Tax=Nonomuraea angiospora TaxID=46172 RepID=UPI0033254943